MKEQIKGNAQKYLSFKEAWARIKSAQEAGFYLEAITIQESIMSDRITSYLSYKAMLPTKKRPSFADLLREWKRTPLFQRVRNSETFDLRSMMFGGLCETKLFMDW